MNRQAIKARPTTYAGVRMRSRLEAYWAAHLDGMGIKWEYEPQCFAGPDGQWLPDFRVIWQAHPQTIYQYHEIKPAYLWEDAGDKPQPDVLRQMSTVRLTEPDADLLLVYGDAHDGHFRVAGFAGPGLDTWDYLSVTDESMEDYRCWPAHGRAELIPGPESELTVYAKDVVGLSMAWTLPRPLWLALGGDSRDR